jgi:hypothetical protein
MMIMAIEAKEMIETFLQVAALAHVKLESAQIKHELLLVPHRRPSRLPSGLQAVYAFLLGEECLKVGKAGPKTQARFTSQHYGMNAPSTLAKSILRNRQRLEILLPSEQRNEVVSLIETTVGAWIERNTSRFHIFLPITAGPLALALLEAFVQCRLNPIFEGRNFYSEKGLPELVQSLESSASLSNEEIQ